MNAGPKRYVVKVRWEHGLFAGPSRPQQEAEELAAALEQKVFDCGDGPGFVQFTGYDGRTLRIRGREVIAIECNPHAEETSELPRPGVAITGGAIVTGGGTFTADGTDFLRRQAGRVSQGSHS